MARDLSGLTAERNVLRYLPVPVLIRWDCGPLPRLLRVLAAGLRAGGPLTVSTGEGLPAAVLHVLAESGEPVDMQVKPKAAFHARAHQLSQMPPTAEGGGDPRVSLVLDWGEYHAFGRVPGAHAGTAATAADAGTSVDAIVAADAVLAAHADEYEDAYADAHVDDRRAAERAARAAVAALHEAMDGSPDVAVYAGPVVCAADVELLPFLHEQAVSITAHRFGTAEHLTDHLL